MTSTTTGHLLEAVALGVAGGAMAAAVSMPFELAVPFGIAGAVNGAISGWRGTYDLRSVGGAAAFTLDSTWSIVMTTAGVVANLAGLASPRSGYVAELSERRNRHVYRRGFVPRPGFATTLGNVISGVADTSVERRRRLVTDHEGVHVWQARWFGPLFPLLYGGWMLAGGLWGAVAWARGRHDERLSRMVDTYAYYLNPFEYWAYSRGGQWPHSAWSRASARAGRWCVRSPFAAVEPTRRPGRSPFRRR